MNEYIKSVELRWGDLDSNQHVTHSKYYELGAHTRMSYFMEHGFTLEKMTALNIGPILFREECIFRRELNVGEVVEVFILSKTPKNNQDKRRHKNNCHQILNTNKAKSNEHKQQQKDKPRGFIFHKS